MKRKMAGTLLLALVLLALSGVYQEALAAEQSPRVIRVAYPIQAGLTDLDEQGRYDGYTYEYLEAIAQYTGWNYEFVQIPGDIDTSLSVMLEMLEKGELDLMGSILYSDGMYERFDYSGHSYGTVKTVLQVLEDNPAAFKIDVQKDQVIRVALLEGSQRSLQELYDYSRVCRLLPEVINCADEAEILAALQQGRADAIINTSLNYTQGVRTIAEFAPKPFYFITTKGSGIMQQLDDALIAIEQADPNFSATLYSKYFSSVSNKVLLTEEEMAYIENVGPIHVGVLTNQPPYQYLDNTTGNLRGIGLGVLEEIAQQVGLEFVWVPLTSIAQCQELMSQGQLDMVAGLPYSYNLARERNMVMTRPYVAAACVLLSTAEFSDMSSPGKVAVLENMRADGLDKAPVMYYATAEECVEAVSSRQMDYAYLDSYAAQFYQGQPQYSDLRIIPWSSNRWQICFGVAKPGHQELVRILNKALLNLPEETMQSIIYETATPPYHFSIRGLLKTQPILFITIISGVLLLVIFALLLLLYQRWQINKQTAMELKHRMQVYHLANEQFFEYHHQSKQLFFSASDQPDAQDQTAALLLKKGRLPQASEEALKTVILEQRTGSAEIELLCGDGHRHWLRLIMENVNDGLNNPMYTIGKLQLIDQEKQEKDQLLEQVRRDGLTNLYHAKTLRQQISEVLAQTQSSASGVLFILDIDYFKAINDTFGHPKGDWVLKQVAQTLEENFGPTDILGRLGGDEFAVYAQAIKEPADALEKGQRLLERLHQIAITADQPITVSIGAAISRPGQSYDELYQQADQALYQAKRKGRNCLELYQTQA